MWKTFLREYFFAVYCVITELFKLNNLSKPPPKGKGWIFTSTFGVKGWQSYFFLFLSLFLKGVTHISKHLNLKNFCTLFLRVKKIVTWLSNSEVIFGFSDPETITLCWSTPWHMTFIFFVGLCNNFIRYIKNVYLNEEKNISF